MFSQRLLIFLQPVKRVLAAAEKGFAAAEKWVSLAVDSSIVYWRAGRR
jgi:hypothetical protein